MEIYVSRRRDINKGYWMSFENHPRLEVTKKSIYERCLPCLEKLYQQLVRKPTSLLLEEPLDCWKVIVVLNNLDQGLDLLQKYQDEKLPTAQTVRGRVGTNDKSGPNVVVIFQVNDQAQRDELIADLERMAGDLTADYSLFYERGCQDLYRTLCGDWGSWDRITYIQHPERISDVAEKVAKLLRGEY